MKSSSTRIQYLDGIRFKRVVNAAAKRLIEKHGHLNDINVFPVPDGDTGSNMAGTMDNVVKKSADTLDQSIGKMSEVIAESALLGARGNSGVILAQFFCGFSEGVKGLQRVTLKDFSDAASNASKRALEAISEPKEGTILTVIRDWSDHLSANHQNYNNFHDLLYDSLEHAKESVLATKEKLASLKAADVVDAGALGFVYLLEGIVEFTERGSLNRQEEQSIIPEPSAGVHDRVAVDSLTYSFCTECMISGEGIDRDALRKEVGELGDSLVVAGTSSKVRVHVHTNEPETVFQIAAEYGEVSHHKKEDMLEQHRNLLTVKEQRTGILTDSTCDLPDELIKKYDIHVAPLKLYMDGSELLDKVDISTEEFNRKLADSKSVQTSQPSPGHYKALYEKLNTSYEEVLAMHVMAIHSGTFQSSKNMGASILDNPHAIDTYTVTGGLGLVTLEAAKLAQQGKGAKEIAEKVEEMRKNVFVLVAMDTVDFAVRGGRLNKNIGTIAKLLNIKPVLEFATRNEGLCGIVAKCFGVRHSEARLIKLLKKRVQGKTNLRFAITHVEAPEKAKRLTDMIKKEFHSDIEFELQAAPVLGCYSGPGACAVSVLCDS
ncbi:DegV family protein [Halodesulfovibrio sp.]|uniref:DAK2 domain-containing protein n=1 Tax=Halodesulfovibrio sp. TaxID=1912772 RepID=UPI0025CF92DF|nr:DegV family protein [Halodesulfovibrio sp.]MCT4533797.1 DegV family EDD domain-containing protein [Halodesulfovibrio sp.]